MTRHALLLTLLALLVAGCSAPFAKQPALERHLYAVIAQRPQAAGQADGAGPLKTVLKVRPFQVSPAYQGKEMVYRLGDTQFETDYYNTFFVAPAPALSQQAEEWLGRSGLFGHVVDSTSQLADTHVLEAVVNAMYGDFRDKAHPKAVLEMQFFVLRNKDERYQVAFSKNYAAAVPFSTEFGDASKLAEAYNTALTQILGELERDLRGMGR